MSWFSQETKKITKALHLPPITLRSVVAAGAGAGLPFFGSANAALGALPKKRTPAPRWQDSLHAALSGAVDRGIETVQNAQEADTVVTGVKGHAPLLIGAAIVGVVLLTRKR